MFVFEATVRIEANLIRIASEWPVNRPNQRQRYRIAISEMGRQVRMLLRKKVR